MTTCIICGRKETRNRLLNTTSEICDECNNKIDNSDNQPIDESGEVNLPNSSAEKKRGDHIYEDVTKDIHGAHIDDNINTTPKLNVGDTRIEQVPLASRNISECDSDFKNSLLASLYSQVEFLRSEIQEKNLIIRRLMLRENDFHNNCAPNYPTWDCKSNDNFNSMDVSSSDSMDVSSSECDINQERNKEEEEEFDGNNVQLEEGKKYKLEKAIIEVRKERHLNFMKIKENAENIEEYGDDSLLRNNPFLYDIRNEGNNIETESLAFNEIYVPQIYENPINSKEIWKNGTTLIVGDSMLYGLEENKINNSKIRVFPGSSIEDMYYNLTPLLRKKPDTVVLHVGTNNCVDENSTQVMNKLHNLKTFILNQLPQCNVVTSTLIKRFDNAKAQLTVKLVNDKIFKLNWDIINNENINGSHIGRKGLHMLPHGTGKLALNIIKRLKQF